MFHENLVDSLKSNYADRLYSEPTNTASTTQDSNAISSTRLEVLAYQMEMQKTGSGTYVLYVYDFVAGGTTVVKQTLDIPLWDNDETVHANEVDRRCEIFNSSVLAALQAIINLPTGEQVGSASGSSHNEIIADLQTTTAVYDSYVRCDQNAPVADDDKNQLLTFFEKYPAGLDVLFHRFDSILNEASSGLKVRVDRAFFERCHWNSVIFDGDITSIIIADIKLDSVNQPSHMLSSSVDKFGNSIIGGRLIVPSLPFPDKDTSKQQYVNLPLDLSCLGLNGLSAIHGAISRRAIVLQQTVGNIDYYAYLPSDDLGINTASLEQINVGIDSVHRLVGFPVVRRVYLSNSDVASAYFRKSNPDVVEISNEAIVSLLPAIVAQHEAIHAIDAHWDFNLSKTAFAKIFETPMENANSILEKLNEEHFYNDNGMSVGGHAQENEREVLASLVNSLMHPNWKEHLKEYDVAFLSEYARLVGWLQTALEGLPDLPPNAPIRGFVHGRLESVTSLISSLQAP